MGRINDLLIKEGYEHRSALNKEDVQEAISKLQTGESYAVIDRNLDLNDKRKVLCPSGILYDFYVKSP